MSLTCFLCVLNLLGAQGGALLSSLLAITVGQIVLDMAMKGVGQAINIHDKTLEEEVWDSVTGMDVVKLILTVNAISLQTRSTHAEVMGLKEALDEARKELMEVKNDLKEVKAIICPPKFPPQSFGGGNGSGSGGEGEDGSGGGGDGEDGSGNGSDSGDEGGDGSGSGNDDCDDSSGDGNSWD